MLALGFLFSVSGDLPLRIRDAIMGQRLKATKVEITTAAAIISPNSLNNFPTCPSRRDIGIKAAMSVIDVASTAKVT